MKIIRKMLVHKCMYWSNPVPDGYGGYTFQPPIELKCRWEDINERFITDENTEDLSKSKVYVDRDIMVGGYLLEGLGEDIDLTGNPENITTAYKIKRFDKLPTLKGTHILRTSFL